MKFEDVPWDAGNCVGTDPDAWFPKGSGGWRNSAMVSRICERCQIEDLCLKWAVENRETGYWGGHYFPGVGNMGTLDKYNQEVMAVGCRACGAGPMARCKPTSGNPAVSRSIPPHVVRVNDAKKGVV